MSGIAGWQTDQGRIYIRYGKAPYHHKTRPDALCQSYAVWRYPEFGFSFVDRSLGSNYQLTIPSREVFDKMIKERPDIYDPIPTEEKIPLSCQPAVFKDDNSTILEVYQTLSRTDLQEDWQITGKYLKRGIFLFDTTWQEIIRDVKMDPWLYGPEESILLISWDRLTVDPGPYHLVVEYLDTIERRVGRFRDTLNVVSFDHLELAMSDIIMAREIGDYIDAGELRRGGVRIIPNTLHAYDVNSSILVYFEIYHLTLSPAGRTHFTLNLITERIPDTESISSKIRNLFRRKPSARVVTSYDYQGEVQNEVFYHDIQLEENREGRYRLTIQVEDRLSGSSTSETVEFELIDTRSPK
jgi:hypothetical protein